MNPVIGVGAPWYTSGVHTWNGTAATLNSSPIETIDKPTSSRITLFVEPEMALLIAANWTCPANP